MARRGSRLTSGRRRRGGWLQNRNRRAGEYHELPTVDDDITGFKPGLNDDLISLSLALHNRLDRGDQIAVNVVDDKHKRSVLSDLNCLGWDEQGIVHDRQN